MDLQALLNSLVPSIGQGAVDLLAEQLKDISHGANEAWQKTVLNLLAQAVEANGPGGIQMAMDAINSLFDGEEVVIDWADLETASDIVAQLQNAEADQKKAVNDYLTKITKALGVVLNGLIRGLITS